MAKLSLRHPSLSSASARKRLLESKVSEVGRVFYAVDGLGALNDALHKLATTADPNLTKESRALKYAKQYEIALKKAQTDATNAALSLDEAKQRLRTEAEIKAGLHNPLSESAAQEIRTALRNMTQKQRDDALTRAAEVGDMATLRAVRQAPSPLLVGAINCPIDSMIEHLIQTASPELSDQLNDIDHAETALHLAFDAFRTAANRLRDPVLESQAKQHEQEASEAERALQLALSGHVETAKPLEVGAWVDAGAMDN